MAEFETVAGPYSFTEGPVWDGERILFTDIPTSRIMAFDPTTGDTAVHLESTEKGNGMALDARRRLYACQDEGRRVVRGDATDEDFCDRIDTGAIELVLLALPAHAANMTAIRCLTASGFGGELAAIGRFPDEVEELRELGVPACNIYHEAGAGFAEHVLRERTPAAPQGGDPTC